MSTDPLVSQFGDALGEFDCDISLVSAPTDWLHANTKHIYAAVNDFLCSKLGNHVYPRFYEYTIAHLELCNPSLVSALTADHLRWIRNTDEITHLAQHQEVRKTLWHYLNLCKQKHSSDTSAGIRVRKLLRLDTLSIIARILAILYDSDQRKRLIHERVAQAQSLLDLFQELLDLPDSDLGIPDIRSPIVRAVVELSKTSGLYPRSLVLQNVLVQERVPVASGRFGSILRGEIEGRTIAIKTMQLETSLKAFCKEAVLWRQLSNRHVLPLFGVYHLPERPLQVCLVSPWMTNGNVVEYLEKNPLADRRTLVIDIARGLEYLHSFDPPILHGDLKGANILVDVSHRACVADFGLGTLVQDSIVQFTPTLSAYQAGTPMSMAPELFSEGEGELMPKALSSDIYSFGCVCYEIFIGKPRFPQCKSIGQMILAVINDQRPSRPSIQKIDDATWALMNRCWDFNPPSRPSANDILRILAPQSKPSGPQSPRVRRRGTIMTNPQSPEAYDLSDATNFAERVTEGLSSSQLDRMSFLPNGVPKETASEPPTHMQRASSDNQSIWVDNSRRVRGISAPEGVKIYVNSPIDNFSGSFTSLGIPQAIARKHEQGHFVDMIYPATGRPREWSNWRSIPIEIGDYGITNQKTGVFEVYGNIYSSAIRESLKKVDPGMDLDRYRPKVGDVEPDLIIYSKGVVSCPFETGVEATVHGLTNASFKHRWKFAKGNDGAVLVMRRPRQSKIPKEILGTLTTLPELAGKDIVSSTFSSPQYFIYSSRGAGEKLSLALIPKESPAHSGEVMVNGTAALGLDWWTDAGPSAHIRKGCDEAGRYSFTPLCLMRHKAPPYSAFFRYEG